MKKFNSMNLISTNDKDNDTNSLVVNTTNTDTNTTM
jgi:hypothetical protein